MPDDRRHEQHQGDLPPAGADEVHHQVPRADPQSHRDGELGHRAHRPLRRVAQARPRRDRREERLRVVQHVAREQVGRKSVLLTMVMLVFFMPVLMVALAGPAVSDVIETLGHVAHDLQNSRKR